MRIGVKGSWGSERQLSAPLERCRIQPIKRLRRLGEGQDFVRLWHALWHYPRPSTG